MRGVRARLCVFRVPTQAPERMPRNKGTRRARKSGAKTESTARVVDTEGVEEGKEEPEVEVEENECDGVVERDDAKLSAVADVLVQESIEWAQEREMNERAASITYAAQAIACLEKWKERGSVPGDWWYWAYERALGEFGCCIQCPVTYKEIFPGLFCGGCDEYVNDCRCKRLCECGVYVAKWGWSDVGAECECTPRKPRGAEWEEADPRFRMKGLLPGHGDE